MSHLPVDDPFAEKLAKLHESLMTDAVETTSIARNDTAEADQRFRRAEHCLRLIERVRRVSSGHDPLEETDVSYADVDIPQRIGRFVVDEQIGSGGYGVVFAAHDPRLNRRVALKVPRPEVLVTPALRQRFLREAEAAASLNHPHVVAVYEAGSVGAICYIASAMIDGPSLADWLAAHGEPVSPPSAARLVRCLADAVHHAHSRGVLHRDLKPSNVLLETAAPSSDAVPHPCNGRQEITGDELAAAARLTDFGLARLTTQNERVTAPNVILGTPAYMSPEQANGATEEIGTASDVFGLGAILYELLTGAPPFERESPLATLQAVRAEEPIAPSRNTFAVPRDLDAICLKCLEKNPEARYASAAALTEDLTRFLDGESVLARPITNLERLWRWSRHNRVLAVALMTVSLLALVVLLGGPWAALSVRFQRDMARGNLDRALEAEELATTNETLAKHRLYESLLIQARSLRSTGHAGQRFDCLQAIEEASALVDELSLGEDARRDLRTEAIAACALTDLRIDRQWPKARRDSHVRLAVDPHAQRYARLENTDESGFDKRQLVVRAFDDNRLLFGLDGSSAVPTHSPYVCWSDDGYFLASRHAAATGVGFVHVWDLRDKTKVLDEPSWGQWHDTSLDISSNGQRVAFVGKNKKVIVSNATDGAQRTLSFVGVPYSLRLSPNGDYVAANTHQAVQIAEIATGNVTTLEKKIQVHRGAIAWGPRGRLLASSAHGLVTLWDADTGGMLNKWLAHDDVIKSIAFSHSGGVFATSSWSNETRLWDAFSGRSLVTTTPTFAIDFSADDKWLGWGNQFVGRWEVALGSEVERYGQSPGSSGGGELVQQFLKATGFSHRRARKTKVNAIDLHPSGKWVAVLADRSVRFYDVESHREVPGGPLENVSMVRFSHDASSLWLSRGGGLVEKLAVRVDEDGPHIDSENPQTRFISKRSAPGCGQFDISRDGSVLALSHSSGSVAVIDVTEDRDPIMLKTDGRFNLVATSPNGQWVAAGPFQGKEVRVFDSKNGRRVATFASRKADVAFDPTGKWLGINGHNEVLIVDVATWDVSHRLSKDTGHLGPLSFDSEGRVLFATLDEKTVTAIDVATGQPLAIIHSPIAKAISSLHYDHQHELLLIGRDHAEVWDVKRIRQRLDAMNLDWPR